MSLSKNSFKPSFVIGGDFLIVVVKELIFACILKKKELRTGKMAYYKYKLIIQLKVCGWMSFWLNSFLLTF